MERKVSVIIPIYNVEKYLCQCLDSIIDQSYKNLEIILVDDGSPDNCGVICDEYAAKDSRIVVIHKANGGLSAARNDGIARATGDWVAFVDSDDWCEPDYYEQLLASDEEDDVDVIFAGGHILEADSNGRKVVRFASPSLYSGKDEIETLVIKSITAPYGYPWDKLYRTEFLKGNDLIFDVDCRAAEDAWFNFQVFNKVGKVRCCAVIGYHYRYVAMSITRGFSPGKPAAVYELLTKIHCYTDKYQLSNHIRQAVDSAAIGFIAMAMNCYYFHPANTEERGKTCKEFKEMKNWPLFHEAIWCRGSHYTTKKMKVLRYALRLPGALPARLLCMGNQWVKKVQFAK